jgi:hypothetical protein
MPQQISIMVGTDGAVEIETTGFSGKSCKDATAGLEKALGVTKEVSLKREYHQQVRQQQRAQR